MRPTKFAVLISAVMGFVGAALSASPALADAKHCKLEEIAELPVTMNGLVPIVTAKINGAPVRFIADSGAFYSLITPGSAAELKLTTYPAPYGMRLSGVGGESDMYVTTVKTFTLAGVDVPHVQFIVGGSETDSTGLLGQNVLGLADVEYDLAHGVIRLMKPVDCGYQGLAYWAGADGYYMLTLQNSVPNDHHTIGEAYVNDTKIRVIFDTGAAGSVLSLQAAARAGIKPDGAGVKLAEVTRGLGRKVTPTWNTPIKSFKVGGEEIRNTHLLFSDMDLPDTDMLLGADFFLSHRVLVSNSQHKIYFTYNGGPVFSLDGATMRQDQAGEAPKASPVVASGDTPTDAEGFSRRGAVLAARHEYDKAIADFDQAIKMAPTEPRYVFQRALARLENKQPERGLADLDETIRLKPDHTDALLLRAEMRPLGEKAAALTELDAANRAAPKEAQRRLAIGNLYLRFDAPELALTQYDVWIGAHPDDSHRPEALAGRCHARALLNRDLDKALADCNAANRLRPRAPSFLESRGLVRLRRGETDLALADFSAALLIEPSNAWALYGRGLAEKRKGDKTHGDADLAAAVVLRARLTEEAKLYGLTP